MRPIFKSARTVYIYLGEMDPKVDSAIDWFEEVNVHNEAAKDPFLVPADVLVGLSFFLDLPWFRRVWIIQEFALAKEIVMMTGKRRIDLDFLIQRSTEGLFSFPRLINVRPKLVHFENHWSNFKRHKTRASRLSDVRFLIQKERYVPLLDLLRRFMLHETSLERDHLFGLLGIAGNDGKDPDFVPDYDEALYAVVQRYARRFIERKEISILEDAGFS
jgi:hypothetical protein